MNPRPGDCCNPQACDPIMSGYDRTCFGRLREKRPDPNPDEENQIIFNTHCLCLDGEPLEFNDEDAAIFMKGFAAARGDVEANHLYRPPGYGSYWH